jgi:hypothetical protein
VSATRARLGRVRGCAGSRETIAVLRPGAHPRGMMLDALPTRLALAFLRAASVASRASAQWPTSNANLPVADRPYDQSAGSGAVRSYTVYGRNAAAAFCPPATFNTSSGCRITW